MHILVVGLGSIGRRHVRNLKRIEPSAEITAWRRIGPDQSLGDSGPLVDRVVYSLEEALSTRPDAALVTNPAPMHVETGLALAHEGIHLFIEKPISNTLDGVNSLMELCRARGLALMVGYNFRFYSPLQAVRRALDVGSIGRLVSLRAEVGQYLPDWRPGSDYRQGVSANAHLGGGALLEQSHELDYARWLAGEVEAVSAQAGHLSDLDMDVEDTAEVLLRFSNGAFGSVHLDMVQKSMTRTCRIIGTEGTLTWDWSSHRARLFTGATGTWTELCDGQGIDSNDMYLDEMRHFLDCVRGYASPMVGGEDGLRALEIALAARRSSEEGHAVEIASKSSTGPRGGRGAV